MPSKSTNDTTQAAKSAQNSILGDFRQSDNVPFTAQVFNLLGI